MLEVRELHKRFGPIHAVRGVSFKVEQGEVLGFLGPNGAGKSTSMRMITGFLPPTSGTAIVNGHDIVADPIQAKKQIGYLPENAPVYGDMTVTHFLRFTAEIRGYSGAARGRQVDAAIEKAHLDKVRHQPIGTLSKGYKQRVCFAQAILHDPPILVMDEPTDGLDPNQKHVVRTMIREMAARKVIVISTHILEEVEAICTRAIIIASGRIVANGTPAALKARSPAGRLDDVFRDLTLGDETLRKAG
jgi:ABC-2 type transport system ATP-binding protein